MKVPTHIIDSMRIAIEPFSSNYIASHSCGLSVQTVNNFRTKKTKPSLETYFGICEFIGFQIAYMNVAFEMCLEINKESREYISRNMAAQGKITPVGKD